MSLSWVRKIAVEFGLFLRGRKHLWRRLRGRFALGDKSRLTAAAEWCQVIALPLAATGLVGLLFAGLSYRHQLLIDTSESLQRGVAIWTTDSAGCRLPASATTLRQIPGALQQLGAADRLLSARYGWVGVPEERSLLSLAAHTARLDIGLAQFNRLPEPRNGEVCPALPGAKDLVAELAVLRAEHDGTLQGLDGELRSAVVTAYQTLAAMGDRSRDLASGDEAWRASSCLKLADEWRAEAELVAGSESALQVCTAISRFNALGDEGEKLRRLALVAGEHPDSWAANFYYARALYESNGQGEEYFQQTERLATRAEQLAPDFPLGVLFAGEAQYRYAKFLEKQPCQTLVALARYRAAAGTFARAEKLLVTDWPVYRDEADSVILFLRDYADTLFELGDAAAALTVLERLRGLGTLETWRDEQRYLLARERRFLSCLRFNRCDDSAAYRAKEFRFRSNQCEQ